MGAMGSRTSQGSGGIGGDAAGGRAASRHSSLVSRLCARGGRGRGGVRRGRGRAGALATPTTIPIQPVPGSWAMSNGGRECAGGEKPAEGGPRTEARRRKDGARAFLAIAIDGSRRRATFPPLRSLRLQFSPLFSRAQGARPGGAAFLPRPNGWAGLKPHPRNHGLKFGNCRFRVRRAGRRSGGCRWR